MLILSRRLGESIVIGEDVNITILGVTGNQIRIGIDAPKSVSVHRKEIYNKINTRSQADEPTRGSNHLRSRTKLRLQNGSSSR